MHHKEIYTHDNNVRLHCLVNASTYQALEEWRSALGARREIALHYPSGVPLSYAARIALLIGLDAIKNDKSPGSQPDLNTETPPRGFGISCPVWLIEEIDELAYSMQSVRSRTLRLLFEAGLENTGEG